MDDKLSGPKAVDALQIKRGSDVSNPAPWLAIVLAGVTLVGTVVSAAFAAVSTMAGTEATQKVDLYQETFAHDATFSQRLEGAVKNLDIDKTRTRVPSDKAATEVFSLFAIAEQLEEKRSLLYVALASHNEDLQDLLSEFLGNSQDQEDQALEKEFRRAIIQSSHDNGRVKSGEDSLPSPKEPTTNAISNVTAENAAGWAYLGRARDVVPSPRRGEVPMETSYIEPSSVPKTGDTVVFTTFVHLRSLALTPRRGLLPPIIGIISKGQTAQVLRVDTHPIDSGYAIWAHVQLCAESGCR